MRTSSNTIEIKGASVKCRQTDGSTLLTNLSVWTAERESELRRLAYRDTPIEVDSTFFDNSDLKVPYRILLIYDAASMTPLLSARYYFDDTRISKAIQGFKHPFLESGSDSMFLIDRMSANSSTELYRRNRNRIMAAFHMELFKHTRGRRFIAMARVEPGDKLMKKYRTLGMAELGKTMHQSKEHWVLAGDMEHCYTILKTSMAQNLNLTDSEMPPML